MRLIDVEELNKDLTLKKRILTAKYGEYSSESGSYMSWKEVFDLVNGAPVVDAVEVVRCASCQHWGKSSKNCVGGYRRCALNNAWQAPEFYCASGERREE